MQVTIIPIREGGGNSMIPILLCLQVLYVYMMFMLTGTLCLHDVYAYRYFMFTWCLCLQVLYVYMMFMLTGTLGGLKSVL